MALYTVNHLLHCLVRPSPYASWKTSIRKTRSLRLHRNAFTTLAIRSTIIRIERMKRHGRKTSTIVSTQATHCFTLHPLLIRWLRTVHCLEDLVQEVMCKADVSPYTSRWYAKDPRPTGNSDIAHECVNWDLLRAEFKKRHVNPWEPGMIVHPIFGK